MTREQAYEILNPLQNKVAFSGLNIDIVTFSAFMDEGDEMAEFVANQVKQYS